MILGTIDHPVDISTAGTDESIFGAVPRRFFIPDSAHVLLDIHQIDLVDREGFSTGIARESPVLLAGQFYNPPEQGVALILDLADLLLETRDLVIHPVEIVPG